MRSLLRWLLLRLRIRGRTHKPPKAKQGPDAERRTPYGYRAQGGIFLFTSPFIERQKKPERGSLLARQQDGDVIPVYLGGDAHFPGDGDVGLTV